MGHERIAMVHAGVLQHGGGMCIQRFGGAQYDFMHDLPRIFDFDAHGFTELDGELIGGETHVITHAQSDGAGDRAGLTCDAPCLLGGGRCLWHWVIAVRGG